MAHSINLPDYTSHPMVQIIKGKQALNLYGMKLNEITKSFDTACQNRIAVACFISGTAYFRPIAHQPFIGYEHI